VQALRYFLLQRRLGHLLQKVFVAASLGKTGNCKNAREQECDKDLTHRFVPLKMGMPGAVADQ
jgi:hypothetical protein